MAALNNLCLVSTILLSVVFALSTYPTMALVPKIPIPKARVPLPAASSKLVAQICKGATNRRFCLKALSGPKAATAKNLNQLMKVAMDSAMVNAQATLNVIEGMIKQPGGPPQALKALQTCVDVYKYATLSFGNVINEIVEDPQTANYDVAVIGPEAVGCVTALMDAKIQAPRITVGNRFLQYYSSIGSEITNAAEIMMEM